VLLRSLKGHKGRVNSVAVHPSGKVGLSVGNDRTLHMWDLMRGKGSAGTKLGKEGEIVRWSLKGDKFVVQSQASIDVYSTSMAPIHSFTHSSRVHDVKFCRKLNGEGELLLVTGEDKKVTIYDTENTTNTWPIVADLIGHTNRVKSLDVLEVALPAPGESGSNSTTIVATISSDGKVHVYNLASLLTALSTSTTKMELSPVMVYNTNGSRLVCCSLAEGEPSEVARVLRKGTTDDPVEESEDDEIDAAEEHDGKSAANDDDESADDE